MSLDLIEKALRERASTKVAQQVNQAMQPLRDLVTTAGLSDSIQFGLTWLQMLDQIRDSLVRELIIARYQTEQSRFLAQADQVVLPP